MILCLKENGHGVEIKTVITGDDLKIVTMMFVEDGEFPTLGKRADTQWEEVLKQHQRIFDD